MTDKIDLTGKTVLITGASRGIGEATARHVAGLGAHVVLAARSCDAVEQIAKDIGPQAVGLVCDVADWAQCTQTVAAAKDMFGGVDILINNAGLIDPIARIEDADPADWVAQAIAWLTTDAARAHDGGDFSLKSAEGRAAAGLPLA